MSVVAEDEFARLQDKLVAQWPAIGAPTQDYKVMVVVPSLSMDLPPGIASLIPAYEERYLFLLLLLGQPQAHVIYITSQPVPQRVVDYYLGLIPEERRPSAHDRLTMLSLSDPSERPLTQKLLERPRSLTRILDHVPDRERAHLVFFTTSELERDLALRLGIPMYGAAPSVVQYGTKRGSRAAFAAVDIPHPRGSDVSSRDDVVAAIERLVSDDPSIRQVMVKLDRGIGGLGNAIVDVEGTKSLAEISARVYELKIEGESGGPQHFFTELERQGGIVEERIVGNEIRSPSVQLRVAPNGEVELLSTHDQLLGGETGQAFHGSRFPADPDYAAPIAEAAARIGEHLAGAGVIGRFAIDFVATRSESGWRNYAIEINLRKGGTTHPFLTLQFLTDGEYDAARGVFECRTGPKFYVASDHLEGTDFDRLTPDDLLDLARSSALTWDPKTQRGIVFHMISALPVIGRIGVTAIGSTPREAHDFYERIQAELAAAASSA